LPVVNLIARGRQFLLTLVLISVAPPPGRSLSLFAKVSKSASADIVTQILNFGLPAQIDVRTAGYDRANNLRVARELRRRIAAIPGIVDAHLQQEVDAPAFYATIDRTRAAQLGLNANTIATNLNVSLSSSEQVTPNFWTDPKGLERVEEALHRSVVIAIGACGIGCRAQERRCRDNASD
jgi:hypothetical protein